MHLVYDAGSKFSEESDSGKNTLLPFLRQQGVSKIDKLIISHGDNDHIGGAVSLLTGLPTTQVLTSAPEQLNDYSPAVWCSRAILGMGSCQVHFTITTASVFFRKR